MTPANKARQARYRERNKAKILAQAAIYRAANKEKKADWYHQNRERVETHKAARRRTPEGWTTMLWGNLNARTINGTCPQWDSEQSRRYLENGVRLEMTRDEFAAWVKEKWPQIEALWAMGKRPSVDRIDEQRGYSIENIQILDFSDNCRKSAYNTLKKRAGLDL